MADEQSNVDLVFEGGGVKGIGLGGAYQAIEEKGYRPHSVAGTSAGAITAALVAAGYNAADLKTIVSTMPFPKFMDKAGLAGLGLPGQFANVIKDLGIYEGKFFHEWIEEKLKDRGVTTFGDLYHDEVEDPAKPWKLRVIASDVTHRRMLVLPQDAKHLGVEPDDMRVADAVRMSMSIPIFFEPVAVKGGEDGPHTIVDGGMLSNFPVWLFDAPEGKKPRWPTFGLMLVEPEPRKPIGHRIAARVRGAQARVADRLRQGPRAHDDVGPRPHVPGLGDERAHDHDPDAGGRDHGVPHQAGAGAGALRLRLRRGQGIPEGLRLRGVRRDAHGSITSDVSDGRPIGR